MTAAPAPRRGFSSGVSRLGPGSGDALNPAAHSLHRGRTNQDPPSANGLPIGTLLPSRSSLPSPYSSLANSLNRAARRAHRCTEAQPGFRARSQLIRPSSRLLGTQPSPRYPESTQRSPHPRFLAPP